MRQHVSTRHVRGVGVSIEAFQALVPGSSPGGRKRGGTQCLFGGVRFTLNFFGGGLGVVFLLLLLL